MPRVDMRQFEFTDEQSARDAAASIPVPAGFDAGRTVGKRMAAASAAIKPTAAMVSAQRLLDGESVIGWAVHVDADDAEKRDVLAPLADDEHDIPATAQRVPPVREVRNAETDRS